MPARITGLDAHLNRLSRLSGQAVAQEIDKALLSGARVIRDDAVASIKEGGIPSPNHVASAPGASPNADTHNLDQSIDAIGGGVDGERAGLKATVVVGAEYGAALEFGNSRIQERPYLRPATQRNRTGVVTGVKAAVDRVVARKG